MRLRTPLIVVILVLAAGAAAYVAWGRFGAPTAASVHPVRGTAAEVVYATGTVEPEKWAKVIALQRKRITSLCDCEGKFVHKGDALGQLDDAEARNLLRELEARRARLAGDVDRTRGLVARSFATQTALDQLVTQLSEYDARIAAQQDRIADLVLRAPMDGVVLRKDGEVGEIANIGANDVIFWVGQPKPLRIVADVNEEDIPRVRTRQAVLIRSEGFKDAPLSAKVGEITPKGDPATKTFRVYLALPDDTPLQIGMSVEANIITREKDNALLLPAEAINGDAVFRIVGERLVRTRVRTGIRGSRMIEIVEGVSEQDLVASPTETSFRDGMRVRAHFEEGARVRAPGAP
ncbi:MAG: transporter [Hyphomicrobiales bacterium]|nr:transporter [Hyphomicrobiales bacterium]